MCKKWMRVLMGVCVLAGGLQAADLPTTATAPAKESAATQPGDYSVPADQRVLVMLGNAAVITQADFNNAMARGEPKHFYAYKDTVIMQLVGTRIWELYLQEHPGMVTDEEVEESVQGVLKKLRLDSEKELADRLMENSGTTMEEYRDRRRYKLLVSKVVDKALEKAESPEWLKETYEKNPDHFNGARVAARQIMFKVAPYETAEEIAAKRARLEKIREDLISGKRTWEECLKESDWGQERQGKMGSFQRFQGVAEPVAEAAFGLKVGQYSEVIKSPLGLHLIQIMRRTEGNDAYNEERTPFKIRSWLQKQAQWEAQKSIVDKYPIIGVQPPRLPEFMRDMSDQPTTRPSTRPATAPAK